MEAASLSTTDLLHHVVTFGMDVYPQIDLRDERTRLNMFYEEARARRPDLFDRLITGEGEFRISKKFSKRPEVEGAAVPQDTFVLTNRGPVFVFPLLLPEPIGPTGLEDTYLEDFKQLRALFFEAVPPRGVMRVGMIRDLIFSTGTTPLRELVIDLSTFANADLDGGQLLAKYSDTKCNHLISIASGSVAKTTRLAMGRTVQEDAGYGVRVRLDVNNVDMQKALTEPDIEEVIERATSLWPDSLLDYLGELERRRHS